MTDCKKYELPIPLESCIKHLEAMYGGKPLTAEEINAVEATHDYIEKHMQMLGIK